MPVYEYRCRDCGHEFEIQQSITEDALTECPRCSGNLRKVFSPVGITFKGSGFYKTDSRPSSGSGSSGSGSSGSESSGSSGSGTTPESSGSSSGGGSSSTAGDSSGPAPSSNGSSGTGTG